mmetsp:Transcript_13835/g.54667  ORF Transcript_13835/g.54667 Transcript_13835/m.54667 type:complete len:221 (+) Transcript_13835:388-1050(+)
MPTLSTRSASVRMSPTCAALWRSERPSELRAEESKWRTSSDRLSACSSSRRSTMGPMQSTERSCTAMERALCPTSVESSICSSWADGRRACSTSTLFHLHATWIGCSLSPFLRSSSSLGMGRPRMCCTSSWPNSSLLAAAWRMLSACLSAPGGKSKSAVMACPSSAMTSSRRQVRSRRPAAVACCTGSHPLAVSLCTASAPSAINWPTTAGPCRFRCSAV